MDMTSRLSLIFIEGYRDITHLRIGTHKRANMAITRLWHSISVLTWSGAGGVNFTRGNFFGDSPWVCHTVATDPPLIYEILPAVICLGKVTDLVPAAVADIPVLALVLALAALMALIGRWHLVACSG